MNDVCVIGGGPAGLAAAIALRMRGLTVQVMDARRPPIDKACGEGFLPGSFAALRALGIDAAGLPGVRLRGIRFFGEGVSVAGRFPVGEGRGVRRTELHAALVARAEELGVVLRWGHPVANFDEIRAGWIVGADGIQSRVRQWAGLGTTEREQVRFGFQRHYESAPWGDHVEVYWGARGQACVTPVGDREIGVAVLTRDRTMRFDEALAEFPALSARLAGARAGVVRGGVTATRRLRRVARGRVVLVGDASGSVDAITGEGLVLSFRQAALLAAGLAEALVSGDLAAYESGHRSLARRVGLMGDLMLTMDRSSFIRRRALGAMAAHPAVFEGLLAMHTGDATAGEFVAGCLRLGCWMAIPPPKKSSV